MSAQLKIFKSSEGAAACEAAYEAAMALWPVPYEALDLSTRSGLTHVIASGAPGAPPLLLLHGNYASAAMWYRSAADLSRRFRTYALDTIGDLGKSLPEHLPGSREDYAAWLQDVLDALEIESAYLVGLSYGGFLAMNLALAAPQRVTAMVLLNPGGLLDRPSLKWMLYGAPLWMYPSRPTSAWFTRHASTLPWAADDPLVAQRIVGMRNLRSLHVLAPSISEEEFRQLKTPTLLLLGDHDILYNPKAAQARMNRLNPGIQVEIVDHAGHLLTHDQPDVVNARILAFFTAGP